MNDDAIIDMINSLFSDMSREQHETKEMLENIRDAVEELLETLP